MENYQEETSWVRGILGKLTQQDSLLKSRVSDITWGMTEDKEPNQISKMGTLVKLT